MVMSRDTVMRRVRIDKGIAAVYVWLLISPFLTVPAILFLILFNGWWEGPGDLSKAVLFPVLLHFPLLLALLKTGDNLFARRHVQQALLLVALRTFSSWIFLALGEGQIVPWLGINGFLWLWGSLRGRRQVRQGTCWLMHQRPGESLLLKEALAAAGEPLHTAPPLRQSAAGQPRPSDRDVHNDALLQAFRHGTRQERRMAITALAARGEIEQF
jgi:hypothetical protein